MNFFGVDLLQLIIYVCVALSFVVVVYILKLTRTKNKTKTEPSENQQLPYEETSDKLIIKQLIALVDKMWSHQAGLNPASCPNPTLSKRQTRKKPEPTEEPEIKELPPLPTESHSIQKIDEETYTSTEEDEKLLETIRKQLERNSLVPSNGTV